MTATITPPSPADFLHVAAGPAMTADQTALLDYAARLPDLRPIPERDDKGRYLLPHPVTGEKASWRRATNLAKVLDDTYNLELWSQRMVATGLAKASPDVIDAVAQFGDDPGTRDFLNDICADAKKAAGAHLGSELGTAMHTCTEHLDAGTLPPGAMPAQVAADLTAYHAATQRAGITLPSEWIERIVVCPDVETAGTLDRLVAVPGVDGLIVFDVKTAKSMDYSWLATAIQLAEYAHASHMWQPDGTGYIDMPAVNQQQAIVAHMPVGAGTCVLYWIDITRGWQAALLAHQVFEARKGSAKLATAVAAAQPIAPAAPAGPVVMPTPAVTKPEAVAEPEPQAEIEVVAEPATPPVDRTDWIMGRFRELATDQQAIDAIGRCWPPDVPTAPPWTDQQVDLLDQALVAVEAMVSAPFPASDPDPAPVLGPDPAPPAPLPPHQTDPPDEAGPADPATIEALRTVMAELPPGRLDLGRHWIGEAKRASRPFAVNAEAITVRIAAVTAAVAACLTHLVDDDDPDALTRAALTVAYDIDPAVMGRKGEQGKYLWPTGALIGSLTVDQADLLTETAEAFTASPDTAADLGRRVAAAAAAASTPTNNQNSEPTK